MLSTAIIKVDNIAEYPLKEVNIKLTVLELKLTKTRRSRQNPAVREFILRNVGEHPNNISALAAKEFNLSRQAINRYVKSLIDDGLLDAEGKTSARKYRLHEIVKIDFQISLSYDMAEDAVWRSRILPSIENVPKNIVDICQYGFTEILNNVGDHSASDTCSIFFARNYLKIEMKIIDDGIGIFQKIQNDFHLEDARSALLELSKGRLTSDAARHTGEGVFFTSRMFDEFAIRSDDLFFRRKRKDDEEWLIDAGDLEHKVPGTAVYMDIFTDSKQTMRQVFDRYQSDDIRFRKTHVPIKLGRYPNEQLVSRSQAKRILARFDQFQEVMLDFDGIDDVGRAFIDEIFRVYRREHPDVEISWANVSPHIEKTIRSVLGGIDDQSQLEFGD